MGILKKDFFKVFKVFGLLITEIGYANFLFVCYIYSTLLEHCLKYINIYIIIGLFLFLAFQRCRRDTIFQLVERPG